MRKIRLCGWFLTLPVFVAIGLFALVLDIFRCCRLACRYAWKDFVWLLNDLQSKTRDILRELRKP